VFDAAWLFNWAHATFDGFYPIFLSLVRFGRHLDRFRCFVGPVTPLLDEQICNSTPGTQCDMQDMWQRFGEYGQADTELLSYASAVGQGRSLLFEEVLIGSGHGGEYATAVMLPGTAAHASDGFLAQLQDKGDALHIFRDRLFHAYGQQPPPRRIRSNEGRHAKSPLEIVVAHNKRFSPSDQDALREVVFTLNAHSLLRGQGIIRNVSAVYLDCGSLSFAQQVALLCRTDIYVTSTGSSIFYSLLLPDGSVTVNLGTTAVYEGFFNQAQNGQHCRCGNGYPNYGEEFLGASYRRTLTMYLSLSAVKNGIATSRMEVLSLIETAATRIHAGFPVPIPRPEDNLSIFGKILSDLVNRSGSSLSGLRGWWYPHKHHALLSDAERLQLLRSEFLCHQRAHGQASAADLVYEQHKPHDLPAVSGMDLTVLRQLKREYQLNTVLGVHQECECVVCVSCGME